MTKKEKAILKLAQKWAKEKPTAHQLNGESVAAMYTRWRTRYCGRALLKILEP